MGINLRQGRTNSLCVTTKETISPVLQHFCGHLPESLNAALYGIVVRAPDFGLRGPRFETQAPKIFLDLRKVEYQMIELVGGRELWLSILRRGEPVLWWNVVYATYVPH
jgi:hypothetical protein